MGSKHRNSITEKTLAQSEAERWKGLERMELSDNLGRSLYVEKQRKAFYRAIGKYEKA